MSESVLFGGELLPLVASGGAGSARCVFLSLRELAGQSELTLLAGAGAHYLLSAERSLRNVGAAAAARRGLAVVRRVEVLDLAEGERKAEEGRVLLGLGRRARIVVAVALTPGADEALVQQLVLRVPLCPGLEVLGPRMLQVINPEQNKRSCSSLSFEKKV